MEWYTDTVIKCIIAQCIYDRMILFMFLKFVCSHRLRYAINRVCGLYQRKEREDNGPVPETETRKLVEGTLFKPPSGRLKSIQLFKQEVRAFMPRLPQAPLF